MQYLLGLSKFTEKPMFLPELFVLIRKRLVTRTSLSRFRKNRLGGPQKETCRYHRRPRGSFDPATSLLGQDKYDI